MRKVKTHWLKLLPGPGFKYGALCGTNWSKNHYDTNWNYVTCKRCLRIKIKL